jgi:hypothetical protein
MKKPTYLGNNVFARYDAMTRSFWLDDKSWNRSIRLDIGAAHNFAKFVETAPSAPAKRLDDGTMEQDDGK